MSSQELQDKVRQSFPWITYKHKTNPPGLRPQAKKLLGLLFATYLAIRTARFVSWQREMAAKYPGPPVSLLTGNISQMIECGGFTEELFFQLHKKYGDIIRFFI